MKKMTSSVPALFELNRPYTNSNEVLLVVYFKVYKVGPKCEHLVKHDNLYESHSNMYLVNCFYFSIYKK